MMNEHKYDRSLHEHLVAANPICAFQHGLDKLFLMEIPDFENVGYVKGWVLLIGQTPYFISIAGGSDGLSNYIAASYAEYLATELGETENVEYDEDMGYSLSSDLDMNFYAAFWDAMSCAGFVMDEGGRWERRDCDEDDES